jgi:hypothetical protein
MSPSLLQNIFSGERMSRTLRPLSLGQLLDETFNIYRKNFLLFVGISAVPTLILLVAQLVLVGVANFDARSSGVAAALAALGALFVSQFVSAIVTAATTFGVSDIYLERPTSMAACFSRVAGKALRVFLVSFLVSLAIGVGLALCIAPGIYWAGLYGIAMPAVVLENITVREALDRSSSLTRDYVGRVIVVFFLTTVFTIMMAFALDEGASLLNLPVTHGMGALAQQVWREIVAALGGILFGPVTAIALTLVYYDQRVRKEAFDIEHMMQLISAAETSR